MTDTELIEALIKENVYYTIRDYLELRDEIKAIVKATDKMNIAA